MDQKKSSMVSMAGSLHIHPTYVCRCEAVDENRDQRKQHGRHGRQPSHSPVYRHRFLSKTLTVLFQVCSGKYVWLRSKHPAGFHVVLRPGW